ncbi:hypothetical protein [Paraglaciecola sp. 25GB23A]|uniref:hypothetical protein n=1 Tax=Paraglaciecola sp. 25GB23A TaxID=3156068 RepID=UPI0032AF54E3
MSKNWNQKTIDLILDEDTWCTKNGYLPIIHFCIDELAQYGIDPTPLKRPFDFAIFKKFNPSQSEFFRALILINIYKACFKFSELKAMLFNQDRNFDSEICRLAYKTGGQSASLLTYMLTVTLKEKITEEDYNSVVAKLDSYQQDRSKGGQNKAETEARDISRKMAVELKAKNKHLTKPDLTIKIISSMEENPSKFKLKRDIPSFDTVMKWLTNLNKE